MVTGSLVILCSYIDKTTNNIVRPILKKLGYLHLLTPNVSLLTGRYLIVDGFVYLAAFVNSFVCSCKLPTF